MHWLLDLLSFTQINLIPYLWRVKLKLLTNAFCLLFPTSCSVLFSTRGIHFYRLFISNIQTARQNKATIIAVYINVSISKANWRCATLETVAYDQTKTLCRSLHVGLMVTRQQHDHSAMTNKSKSFDASTSLSLSLSLLVSLRLPLSLCLCL